MRRRSRLLAGIALAGGLLLAAPGAGAGKGFLAKQPLHLLRSSGETEAQGGFTAWLRIRNDHSIVQGFRVWVQGLSDAEGATLWVAKPGDADTAEVGSLAVAWDETGTVAENGSGVYEVVVDSARDDNPELPGGVETVLKLFGGVVEVRAPFGGAEDIPVLRAAVGDFHWRRLDLGGSGRTARLRRPPPPATVPDEAASGTIRTWRRRQAGAVQQGVSLFATGLTEDGTYEVWIEDAAGTLAEVGLLESTSDGLGYWALDSRAGETLPAGIDADDVRDLRRRRIEIRRSGFSDYSLAGLFPR